MTISIRPIQKIRSLEWDSSFSVLHISLLFGACVEMVSAIIQPSPYFSVFEFLHWEGDRKKRGLPAHLPCWAWPRFPFSTVPHSQSRSSDPLSLYRHIPSLSTEPSAQQSQMSLFWSMNIQTNHPAYNNHTQARRLLISDNFTTERNPFNDPNCAISLLSKIVFKSTRSQKQDVGKLVKAYSLHAWLVWRVWQKCCTVKKSVIRRN